MHKIKQINKDNSKTSDVFWKLQIELCLEIVNFGFEGWCMFSKD